MVCLCVSVHTWASVPVTYWVQICRAILTSKVLLEAFWSIVYYLIYHFFCMYSPVYITFDLFSHCKKKKNHAYYFWYQDHRCTSSEISSRDLGRVCSVFDPQGRAGRIRKRNRWHDCTSTDGTVTAHVQDVMWFQPGVLLDHDVDFFVTISFILVVYDLAVVTSDMRQILGLSCSCNLFHGTNIPQISL